MLYTTVWAVKWDLYLNRQDRGVDSSINKPIINTTENNAFCHAKLQSVASQNHLYHGTDIQIVSLYNPHPFLWILKMCLSVNMCEVGDKNLLCEPGKAKATYMVKLLRIPNTNLEDSYLIKPF